MLRAVSLWNGKGLWKLAQRWELGEKQHRDAQGSCSRWRKQDVMKAALQNIAPVQGCFGFCQVMLFCVSACTGYLKQQQAFNVWCGVGGQFAAAFLKTLPGPCSDLHSQLLILIPVQMMSYVEKLGQISASLDRMGLIYSLTVAPCPCPTVCSLHCVKPHCSGSCWLCTLLLNGSSWPLHQPKQIERARGVKKVTACSGTFDCLRRLQPKCSKGS